MSLIIGALIMFLVLAIGVVWFFYANSKPPKFNSIVFIHPDHIKVKPEQVKPDETAAETIAVPRKQGFLSSIFYSSSATVTTIKKPVKPLSVAKPDYLSTAYTATLEPDGEFRPFFFNYAWYYLGLKPLWFWFEDKIESKDGTVEYKVKPWEPELPSDYKVCKLPEPKEQRDRGGWTDGKKTKEDRDYITPNALFDLTDWECARRFETVRNKLGETIKLGVAITMAVVCVIGIFLLASSISEKKNQPTTPEVPANLRSQVIDNGGNQIVIQQR